jgi:hypothetical protein
MLSHTILLALAATATTFALADVASITIPREALNTVTRVMLPYDTDVSNEFNL